MYDDMTGSDEIRDAEPNSLHQGNKVSPAEGATHPLPWQDTAYNKKDDAPIFRNHLSRFSSTQVNWTTCLRTVRGNPQKTGKMFYNALHELHLHNDFTACDK